nr:PhnD/SsuA/transferrin family substrate-binding protein [Myxacorys almedinensis]
MTACGKTRPIQKNQLVLGTVSYGDGDRTIAQYERFNRYLGEKLQAVVQLEPAYNERKALERIAAQAWAIVFAPPGLAAIAMTQHRYIPLCPLEGINSLRSVLVVKSDSPYDDLRSLAGKTLAIGQPGSAVGYYFPIFNLYGLTLRNLEISPNPKGILEAIAQGKADVGALSMEEFNTYKAQVTQAEFRVLFTDTHNVPSGLVLLSPTIDRTLQDSIQKILREIPSVVAQEARIVPNGAIPDYKYMISVVERVRTIFPADTSEGAALLTQKPVRLFNDSDPAAQASTEPFSAPAPVAPASGLPASPALDSPPP